MLAIAKGLLEQEEKDREVEKKRYMAETCQALSLPGSMQALQVEITRHKTKIDERQTSFLDVLSCSHTINTLCLHEC